MIKLNPTRQQRVLINEIFDVSRYVYNKTNALVKKNLSLCYKFQDLRNKIVTEKTKLDKDSYIEASAPIEAKRLEIKDDNTNDSEKLFLTIERNALMDERRRIMKDEDYTINNNIKAFELRVSKEIRANAVKNLCDAYKTSIANLKAGNIKYYNISYKKKTSPRQCSELATSDIKMTQKGIRLCPGKFGKEDSLFKLGKKNHKKYKDIIIKSNCDLVKRNDGYYIGLVLDTEKIHNTTFEKVCGIDPGVRTFLTCYGTEGIVEYQHNSVYLSKLKKLLSDLKGKRGKKTKKKTLTKIDTKQKNFIDDIHWKSINSLLKLNDIVFFGDIKSHNIVKGGKNNTLNRQMNELKFYVFKTRLIYKAKLLNKRVVMVNEAYTTQGCSCCGNLWKGIGSSEIYNCKKCKTVVGRDANSAKNMLLKGLLL